MSSLDRPDVMFAIEDDGTLVIERGYGFYVERIGDHPHERCQAGDLVHLKAGKTHRIWRLTGERGWRGSWRGIWPD